MTVVEVAILDVRRGMGDAFEAAFDEATSIISAMSGFIDLELQRCIETDDRFILLVRWQRLEDHTEGFRGSSAYQRWRELLHHFYEPFPTVEHYRPRISVGPRR